MFLLYPVAVLICVAALAGWFYFQDKRNWSFVFRAVFLAAIAAYFWSIGNATFAANEKLSFVFRDLMLIGGSGLLFQLLFKNKSVFLFGVILVLGGLGWYYQDKLDPIASATSADTIRLDEDGELLVELKNPQFFEQLQSLLAPYGGQLQRAFQPADADATELDDYYLVDLPANQQKNIKAIQAILANSDFVDWVEGNEVITVDLQPAKQPSTINKKYGINDPGLELLWGFEAMKMDELYRFVIENKVQPKKNAIIAILDTGVDSQHEDIKDNYKSVNSRSDDDPKGHGTHCAGIAGAVSNNGVGIASYDPGNRFTTLTSIKVLNSAGMGTQAGIIKGMIEAVDKGADVISMSLGGLSNQSKQTAYKKAVDYGAQKGVIVVAAAGNSNRNAKNYAPVGTPGIIGVSAINENFDRAVFSNYVTDIPWGVAAPGVGIYSTTPNNNYATYNGTSMAAPYVSGLVGLMKSIQPKLTAQQAYSILNATGINTNQPAETGMLVQPHRAIELLVSE